MVSADGLSMDLSKVKAVRPEPKSITEVRSFHELASFYRLFGSHFSTIMAPLTDCMKNSKFEWTPEARDAFELIKQKLTITPLFYRIFMMCLNYIVMHLSLGFGKC